MTSWWAPWASRSRDCWRDRLTVLMASHRQQVLEDRSLGDLFSELTAELTTLVRQEAKLARTELTEKARSLASNLGLLAIGGAVSYAGFLALLASLILGLGQLGVT